MGLPTDISEVGQEIKKRAYQVGLGVKTGIDLPNETIGQIEPLTNNSGNYLIYQLVNMTHIVQFNYHSTFLQ